MKPDTASSWTRRRLFLAGISSIPIFGLIRGSLRLNAQDKTGFPDGFDAVAAAPQSHKVLFENGFVRVLQVEVVPGTKEPMHHHRWPSIFLIWDMGGRTGHIRIYHIDGTVHDVPSHETPVSPGSWRVTCPHPSAALAAAPASPRSIVQGSIPRALSRRFAIIPERSHYHTNSPLKYL